MTQRLPQRLSQFFVFFIRKQFWAFLLMQLTAFAWSIDCTLWPYLLQRLIDKMLLLDPHHDKIWHALAPILVIQLVSWLAIDAAFRVNEFIAAWIFPKFSAQIRMALLDYVMGHSYAYFANHFAGNLSNRINDMTQSATRVMQMVIFVFLPAMLALIIASVVFYHINPLFSLLISGWTLLHMGICFSGAQKCATLSKVHADARSFLTGKVVDTLSNIISVKLFARKPLEYAHIATFQADERQKSYRALFMVAKIEVLLSLSALVFPGILITWYFIHCWQYGLISVGVVVLIFNTKWNMQGMAWHAGMQLPELYKEIGICQQAMSLVQVDHAIQDHPNAKALSVPHGEICFEQVSFGYLPKRPVFQDLSVKITAGSKVGLVGFSGSGKSTFVNLILRFFELNSGKITIDGNAIDAVTLDSLRSQIAMIPQDPTLFHRSLKENIGYGKIEASEEAIINAAKQAHCHAFIVEQADGYDTWVGERGIKLSGGQRQRIAIARAMLKDAPILILDEATSALDSVTEERIQTTLHHLMQQRTTLIIAHRLSTLAKMDRILVFDGGRIIEDGNHQQLLQAQGHYARMWAMQAGGFMPENPVSN